MKIKITEKPYSDVIKLPKEEHKNPKKTNLFFRTLMKTLSHLNLKGNHISYNEHGMDKLGKKEPFLALMNHSSFIDLQIAADYLYPRPFSTVCTTDAYVGKKWLMRQIGCIPTQKFVSDFTLLKDMKYALHTLKSTVLMYPEAGYSFDGRATSLPDSIGGLLKLLKVPLVTIITHGAFAREPLYNMLRHREVDISADVTYLLSPEEIEKLSTEELTAKVKEAFSFDNFRYQQENSIVIDEDFRADGLQRVLYKCPHCMSEGSTRGEGTKLVCSNCKAEYELTELGALRCLTGEARFTHIPDWFDWQRDEVRREIEEGKYIFDGEVDIYIMVNFSALYKVGDGRLRHTAEGFHLTGCDGELDYSQSPLSSYSIFADYFWYEIGDMVCIGNKDHLFYCFPKTENAIVAKTRLAAEELFIIKMAEKRNRDKKKD